MTKKELAKFKDELREARSSLLRKVQKAETYGREADAEGEARDIGDRASSSYTKELMFSMSNSDRQLLQRIEAALEKIESGEYSECENCGEEIGKKRLKAVPWAHLCIQCAEKQEAGEL